MATKAKFKLDKKTLQAFFLKHVEKIVLTVVVLGVIGMVYGAVTRPSFLKTPDELKKNATEAAAHLEATPPDPGVKVEDYPEMALRSRNQIDERAFSHQASWNPPIFRQRIKRGEPKLYSVRELRGRFEYGRFLVKGEGANAASVPRGERWVVLTGLVPQADEVDAFNECFRDYHNPQTDVPQYVYYRVQRAEVVPNADLDKLNWVTLNTKKALLVRNQWDATPSEVAPAQFLQESLVFPLGPLQGRPWGEQCVHLPEIPLASTLESQPAPTSPTPGATSQTPDEPGDVPQVKKPAGAAAAAAAPGASSTKIEKFLLFRFFDYSIEPGKRYRYRVHLMLTNPNFEVDSRYLQNADLSKEQFLTTPWSEPTESISVLRDDRVYLASVAPPRRNSDPMARLALVKWVHNMGLTAFGEFVAVRGQLANFAGSLKIESSSDGSASVDLPGTASAAKPARRTGGKDGMPLDYTTDMMVLDMHGGEPFNPRDKTNTEPCSILFVDRDGTLVLRDEITDLKDIEAAKAEAARGGSTEAPASSDASTGMPAAPGTPAAADGSDLLKLDGGVKKSK